MPVCLSEAHFPSDAVILHIEAKVFLVECYALLSNGSHIYTYASYIHVYNMYIYRKIAR